MNGEGFFRSTIGAMIGQGFAVDDVREKLFLKGASEVWGGEEMDSHPAWYFWLANSPGAYRLQLVQSGRMDEHEGSVMRGVFSVKYYPSPLEPVFSHFSPFEQALVVGDAFDHTNTPMLEAKVPENLFSVGTIEFIRDLINKQSFLTYTSLDRLRFHKSSPELNRVGDDESTFIEEPSHPRQIPAWDLGYPLFDASVGLNAFLMRKPPKRVILSRQSGFDFFETNTGDLVQRDSEEIVFKSLMVAFYPECCEKDSTFEESLTSQLLGSPWTPILDTAAPWRCRSDSHQHTCNGRLGSQINHGHEACACTDGHRHMPDVKTTSCRSVNVDGVIWEVPLAFNEQWWLMAEAEQFMKSMCGCH